MKTIRFSSVIVLLAMLCVSSSAWSIGILLPTDEGVPPLAIKSHRVTVTMTDLAAETHVEQVFVNHTDRQLEATFYFPIPEGASVSDFALHINGQRTPGVILEANAARQQYEQIVRRMVDPGLVEYMDGKLFSAHIFPVPANGEQKVEITFTGLVEEESGVRLYTYPMRTGRVHAQTLEDLTITVDVESTNQLNAVYSPTHKVATRKFDDHKARAGLEITGGDLEQDFMLYVTVSESPVGLNLMTYDEDGDGGEDPYFLLVLSPRVEVDEDEVQRKAVTLVIDTSGSMAGEKMDQARETMNYLITQFGENDYFNIIRFSSDVEPLFHDPLQGTQDNREKALQFVAEMEAVGGTAIEEALVTALDSDIPDGVPHYILFLTDGHPTIGTTDYGQLTKKVAEKNKNNTRIFTFGIGYDLNPQLLDKIAMDNHGVSDYVRPKENLEHRVSSFYGKVSYPALSNVSMDMGRIRAYDVYPRDLPDLYRGEQLVVFGRYREKGDTLIRLTGMVSGEEQVYDYEPNFDRGDRSASEERDFIAVLWANRKVGFLLEEIRLNGENEEVKQEVIRLAKKYGIVTPYTSYLAMDDRELEGTRPDPAPVPRTERDEPTEIEHKRDEKRKKAKVKEDEDVYMEEESGEEAITVSEVNRDMKEAESVEMEVDRSRRIGNRTMVYESGTWREDGLSGSNDRIEVVYMSDAYFEVVSRRPDLARCLSLGGSVEVDAGNGVTLVVGSSGIEDAQDDELSRLFQ